MYVFYSFIELEGFNFKFDFTQFIFPKIFAIYYFVCMISMIYLVKNQTNYLKKKKKHLFYRI